MITLELRRQMLRETRVAHHSATTALQGPCHHPHTAITCQTTEGKGVFMYTCMCMCVHVCTMYSMHECTNVCKNIYVCMCVRMYACMCHVYVFLYVVSGRQLTNHSMWKSKGIRTDTANSRVHNLSIDVGSRGRRSCRHFVVAVDLLRT